MSSQDSIVRTGAMQNTVNSPCRVQPVRRQWTCAKAKKTYGDLDKESLTQSGVFPVERWSMSRESV
ncbi:hypothetical protein Taro_003779 [Colocasia esculenta]|uniref:Uncharacterized protein n=1 Tax=Colocasia esculenta TaxID=4460 RepID=A0A843TPY2_COLES|nr:hypothetical protein [Colocasia esculenta]